MTDDPFENPAPLAPASTTYVDAAGITRGKHDDSPRILTPCGNCFGGKVESPKTGRPIKCPKRCTDGLKLRRYVRATTYIGALDDTSTLEKWKLRTALAGLVVDPRILPEVEAADPDDRDTLNRLADRAFEAGDGYAKAQRGTDLHSLTEDVDAGRRLGTSLDAGPASVSIQDRVDMAAYVRMVERHGLILTDPETFVVCDRHGAAGTFDRLAVWAEDSPSQCSVCPPARPKVFDVKTGRVDYGGGKMSMQLAIYANGARYDPVTGERTPLDVCPHVGLIAHVAAGEGTSELLTLDLVAGWGALSVVADVRDYRTRSRHWIQPVAPNPLEFNG